MNKPPKPHKKKKLTLAMLIGMGGSYAIAHYTGIAPPPEVIAEALEPLLCGFFDTCQEQTN